MGGDAKVQRQDDERSSQFVETATEGLKSARPTPLSDAIVQAKLTVGPVDDPYEREADRVADQVMRTLSSSTTSESGDARVAQSGEARAVARQAAGVSKVMRSANRSAAAGAGGGEVEPAIADRIRRSTGGESMDDSTRGRFESAMGADFSGVRVHRNSDLAPQIGAHAFTHGSDVHFAPGAYDPSSSSGQRLIAHELTHVVQQSGTAQRVQAKLWDEKTFKERTAINSRLGFSDASTAQDVILALLKDYEKFLGKGFKSDDPAQAAQAVGKVRSMQDVARRWIKNRGEIYEDPTNYTLATVQEARETWARKESGMDPAPPPRQVENPKAQRMQGLQQFIQLCDTEIALLSRSLSDEALANATIDTSNKQYKKAVSRYPDQQDASSLFAKIGELAELTCDAPGSACSLEITGSIPVYSGVYVTIGVGGSAEKDKGGRVKLRGDIKVGVKGSVAGAAELSAALGGYIEAEGTSGAQAATMMSYALYRRGREGSAPTDLISMLWGGTTGKAGLARSEAWSRQLEEEVFGANEDNYVVSGATGAIGASFGDEDAVSGELSGGAFTGRRVDQKSLNERKGGAGAQNIRSDSILNAGERQKRVGQEVVGWNVGGKISAFGFSLEIGVSRSGRQTGGGFKGGAKQTIWDDLEISASGSGPMPGSLDIAAKVYQLIEQIIRKATEAAARQDDTTGAQGTKDVLTVLAKTSPVMLEPRIDLEPGADLTVAFKYGGQAKGKPAKWSIAIGTEKANEVKIPDILKVELKRTQTFVEISDEGTWYLGQ